MTNRFFVQRDKFSVGKHNILDRKRREVLSLGKGGKRPFLEVASTTRGVFFAEYIATLLNLNYGKELKETK